MAIITKARMQQLRGKYNQLNKEALLPGEFAICDDHNPIVRTNTGYKEILTKDNAEYFEEKVADINNAISSANEAVNNANQAINDMGTATTENTQKIDNAIAQLETDKEQKFTELDTQVTNTVNGAVSDLNEAKEQAIADMEQATSDNTQRVDNAIQQIATKVGIDDTQSSTLTTYSSDKIDKLFDGVSGKLPYKIVTSLPETGDENTLYFVPSTSPESNNIYDEYMYIDGMWEYVGSKAINIEDISESRVDTIEEVGERTPISPKDKMKLIVGKIVKTFADIKNIAFSGSISDITDFNTVLSTSLLSTESGKRALDEVVGKVLNDKIEAILTKQGSTDISNIGNGTVTGAVSTLNSNLSNLSNYKLLYSYTPSTPLRNNMTNYHVINGDFKEICNCDEIVVIPHINSQSNDLYQLYRRNISKQSEIWIGLINPFSIGTATIYEQKISVRINKTSISLLMNNTYYDTWNILGLDIYGR